jgi:hypothetical protein
VALIIQALIFYGIARINNNNVATWRWLLIFFGIVGLIWARVLFFFVPSKFRLFLPEEAIKA